MGIMDGLRNIMDTMPHGKNDGGTGQAYAKGGKEAAKSKSKEMSAAKNKKLPASSEDIVGKQPLVTDEKGKEVIPEIRKKSRLDTLYKNTKEK